MTNYSEKGYKMKIIDPGHIYRLDDGQILKFVKRGGGAIQYPQEWPGIQTQAVMRALIHYLATGEEHPHFRWRYNLWQLGSSETAPLTIYKIPQIYEIALILKDRSEYLNGILECVETNDAIYWLDEVCIRMTRGRYASNSPEVYDIADCVRMALWSYEARAYRRKQEKVNREEPAHDDTARMKAWRDHPASDVPFGPVEIELRPIGPDGHIVGDW